MNYACLLKNWCPREHAYLKEEFEDTKEVIRIRKSKKNRQHNGEKKKYKGINNIHIKEKKITDLQSISNKHLKTSMILLGDQNKQVINDVVGSEVSDLHY